MVCMIGERLEEARKRKGVSIREAAEATKIRGDYLLAMEDNTFDIPLPQIYIRGFLKNYARYLKLDPNKILTDYDAYQLGRSSRDYVGRARSDSLGHVEIPDEEELDDDNPVITEAPEEDHPEPRMQVSLGQRATRESPPPPTLERSGTRTDQEAWNENKSLYIKIGIVFVALLMVSILLILLVRLLGGGSDTPAINPDLASAANPSSQVATQRPVPTSPVVQTSDSFVLSASETVTLTVDQTIDNKRLWSGTLNSGESLTIEKDGPVSIRFTNGAALVIEKNGQRMTPPQAGFGRTVVE